MNAEAKAVFQALLELPLTCVTEGDLGAREVVGRVQDAAVTKRGVACTAANIDKRWIGTDALHDCNAGRRPLRISRITPHPSMRGISKSRISRSGISCSIISMHFFPSRAVARR